MMSKIDLVLVAIAILLSGVILAMVLDDSEIEYVEVEKLIEIEKEVPIVEYRVVETINGYDYRISDNTTMSAYEALIYFDEAIYAHQYYIDRPELQNAGTGDTAFNEKTIKQYQRAKELINRLTEGGK